MKNDVIRKEEISKYRNALRKDISLAISDIDNLSSSLLLDDSLHTMGWCDSFRALLLGLNNSEPAYKNMIVLLCVPITIYLIIKNLTKQTNIS